MICAHCGGSTEAIPCSGCGRAPLLRGRYRLERPLDPRGLHLLAQDAGGSGALVSLLLLPCVDDDDAAVRLDRLRDSIRPLQGPGKPRRGAPRAPFVQEIGGRPVICLASAPVSGVQTGARFGRQPASLGQQLRLLDGSLAILERLHGQVPAQRHGALAPGAIFVDPDGEPAIVGVGLKGAGLPVPWPSTPHPDLEETPATDLYQLGVTAVAAALGRSPTSLVDETGILRWDPTWPIHPLLRGFLQRLTRPAANNRPGDALAARDMLRRLRRALNSHAEAADMLQDVLTGPVLLSPEPLQPDEPTVPPDLDPEPEPTLPPRPTPVPPPAPTTPRDPRQSALLVAVAILLLAIITALVL